MSASAPAEGAIDYWCNRFFPEQADIWNAALEATGIAVKVRTDDTDSFCDADTMVARMDELGIAALILPVANLPAHATATDFELVAAQPEDLERLADDHPGRFFGQWSIDPRTGMTGVDEAATMLAKAWCVGLHTHTHSFDRRFDHADYYPYYALCATHDVPFVMQAGTSGGLMPSECGVPAGIDRPALYFPGVRQNEPPRHWSAELVAFIAGAGRRKSLWGTGFPTVGHRHALGQLGDVELGDEARANLLGDTARRVFTRLG